MKQENIRNVAIIAHVDHGKTTLVDRLLWSSHVFRENQEVAERVLDSNDQERERGITILLRTSPSITRTLRSTLSTPPVMPTLVARWSALSTWQMAHCSLLMLIEGPKPQPRFVLSHALERGLRIVVVVNKIDRPNANPDAAVDKVST